MTKDKKTLEDFIPKKNTSFHKKFSNLKNFETITKDKVIEKIKAVMDPEIPVNLYDLGLIYKIIIDDQNNVSIDMTLTNPNCPVAGTMPESVGNAVSSLKGISSIQVNLIWYPKWSKDMMSEEAKLALDIF